MRLSLFLLPLLLFGQDQASERVRILHPKQDMQFWVDQIEVAGDIPPGSQVSVAGVLVTPDEDGRFLHMITLDQPHVLIPISESRGSEIFHDTIRVFHRNLDHMTADSVFINNNIPDSLELHLGSPRSGIFYGSEVSLRGRTHPDAQLLMNGDTVQVYASGAFAVHVQIEPGENIFNLTASLDGSQITDQFILTRPIPDEILGQLDEKSARPNRDHWLLAGDHIELGIKGPPTENVYYKIPGVSRWERMQEGQPGSYSASYHFTDIDQELNTEVQYRIGHFSKRVHSAPLRILTDALGGLTVDEDTRVYDTPANDQLLFPMGDSVSVQVVGLENRMYKIQLGQYRTGYVRAALVELDQKHKRTSPFYMGSMSAENESDWSVFRIRTGKIRLPFEIKEKGIPARLELKVYGAKQGWEWTSYPEDDSTIAFLERSQPQDLVWQMDFYPRKGFWGWYGRYEGEYLVIGIRKAPRIEQSNLFANVIIEIDPGHGGWERGATGITGYAEADANLRYCLKLEKRLLEAGATVRLTRRDDHRLSLPQRAEIARNDSAHIFVMAHNNAPGRTQDITLAKGASTFYTWPSAKVLSDNIYPHLHEMGIETSGKIARYYYYLTRQTEYLVYLIEGAFMTNPEEEMFLLSEEGLDALANAAFLGLEDFLREKAELE